MRILEIGGDLVAKAFDEPGIPAKLMLDPLLYYDRLLGRHGEYSVRVRGVGEFLPLPDDSIDLRLCFNAVDHMASPQLALNEIQRVLREHGSLVISCNLFPRWTGPAFPLFSWLDSPHPHHFTLGGFKSLLDKSFFLNREYVMRIGVPTCGTAYQESPLGRKLKKRLANTVRVEYVCFQCSPKKTP